MSSSDLEIIDKSLVSPLPLSPSVLHSRLQHAACVWAVSEDDDGMDVEVETEQPRTTAPAVKVPVADGPVNAAYLVDPKATRISLMAFKKLLPMGRK